MRAVFLVSLVISGCQTATPKQEHFTLLARSDGSDVVEKIVQDLAGVASMKVSAAAEKSLTKYELYKDGLSVFIMESKNSACVPGIDVLERTNGVKLHAFDVFVVKTGGSVAPNARAVEVAIRESARRHGAILVGGSYVCG
jgi:hypothetical protein